MNRQDPRWVKFETWFYYNKLYLLVGAIVLYVAGTMVWNVLGIGQVEPDYFVAYVGSDWLPEECENALEAALAGCGEDLNGDGTVAVQLTQHIIPRGSDPMYSYAATVTLLADITQGESTFFLLEDPDAFQKEFQVLAQPDGSIPHAEDTSGKDKVYAWVDCPTLVSLELGQYTRTELGQTVTGDCQALLKKLYLGRRFYHDPSQQAYPQADDRFWQRLTEGKKENEP